MCIYYSGKEVQGRLTAGRVQEELTRARLRFRFTVTNAQILTQKAVQDEFARARLQVEKVTISVDGVPWLPPAEQQRTVIIALACGVAGSLVCIGACACVWQRWKVVHAAFDTTQVLSLLALLVQKLY